MRNMALIAILALGLGVPAAALGESPLVIDPASPSIKWGPCPPIFKPGCQIAVLHGDPARPNADVLLRVPGGFRLAPHRHTSAERMMLVSGRFRVRYAGGPARILTPGTYAFGPAGLPHEATCLGRQRCTLFIAFEGPVDAIAETAPLR